jgi:hypothetical protein
MVWPWGYSIGQIAGFELAHGVFSALCALLVSLPVVYWIWITYRRRSQALPDSTGFTRAVFFMVLLSFGVGLCAHVLEDIFMSWF